MDKGNLKVYQMDIDQYLESKGTSREELNNNAEELASHFNDLNKAKSEKLTDLENRLSGTEKGSQEIQDKHDSLRKEFEALRTVQLKQMQKALEEQGISLQKALVARVNDPTPQGIKSVLENKENKELLQRMADKKSEEKLYFKINRSALIGKAATDPITQSGSISGGDIPQAYRRNGVVEIRRRKVSVKDYITVIPQTESNTVEWVEEQNLFENTAGVAENTLKPQMSLEWVVRRENAKLRAVWIKVSNQALKRIDYMSDQISRKLMQSLENDEESQILFGDGTGENFDGIFTVATPYSAGTFAGTFANPDYYTVLRTAYNQIATANQTVNGASVATGGEATVFYVSPTAMATMDLTEGSDGHYKLPPFMGGDNANVKGVRIEASNYLTADQFAVWDGTAIEYYPYEEIEIAVGYENQDFTKNMRTVRGEHSALLVAPTNTRTSIVVGTFSTALTALTTV